jgi:hypothetical protein
MTPSRSTHRSDPPAEPKATQTVHDARPLVAAVRALVKGWEATGFYDRQDAASGLALHEALTAYEHKR